jgi:hypothetical protein
MSVILATQKAEIRRIEVRSQPRQIVRETLSRKYLTQKWACGVAQRVGPEFKPWYYKTKTKTKTTQQQQKSQTLCCLSHTSSAFCSGYFGDGVS